LAISDADVAEIESTTRGQRNNQRWMEERTKRLTSSNFGEVCKSTDRRDMFKLAKRLMSPSCATGPAINHGVQYEAVAVSWYEEMYGVKTLDSGLFVSKEMPYLAASPDRIVNNNTLLEVKCPYSAKDQNISELTVPYLELENKTLSLKQNHNYYYQIQGQLEITGRNMCHLLIFTLADKKVISIPRNPPFIQDMKDKLKSFYHLYFQNMFVDKVLYKGYSQFNFKAC